VGEHQSLRRGEKEKEREEMKGCKQERKSKIARMHLCVCVCVCMCVCICARVRERARERDSDAPYQLLMQDNNVRLISHSTDTYTQVKQHQDNFILIYPLSSLLLARDSDLRVLSLSRALSVIESFTRVRACRARPPLSIPSRISISLHPATFVHKP